MSDSTLLAFMRRIAGGEAGAVTPALARAALEEKELFLEGVMRQLYRGDTALHVAAAAYDVATVDRLLAAGADVRARNRRGAEPLHSAAVGGPGAPHWNPPAQAKTIARLVAAGADPNAAEPTSGVTPLHRAARTRCAEAVRALLAAGADPRRKNKAGSTPLQLARQTTGRGGTGSAAAKAEQAEIIRLLTERA